MYSKIIFYLKPVRVKPGILLAGSHFQSKIYKWNDNKAAAKNPVRLMFKKGYHGYFIKIIVKEIK